jgi:hypothetical protein
MKGGKIAPLPPLPDQEQYNVRNENPGLQQTGLTIDEQMLINSRSAVTPSNIEMIEFDPDSMNKSSRNFRNTHMKVKMTDNDGDSDNGKCFFGNEFQVMA